MITEADPFPWQQVPLQAERLSSEKDDTGWQPYLPPKWAIQRPPIRLGGVAVGSFATRLIQRERAKARRARALEQAARRWADGGHK